MFLSGGIQRLNGLKDNKFGKFAKMSKAIYDCIKIFQNFLKGDYSYRFLKIKSCEKNDFTLLEHHSTRYSYLAKLVLLQTCNFVSFTNSN